MTDKEQIIINGVNVSECIDFNKRDKISCYHLLYDKCDEVPNCYFKQLARKTQECEKLTNKNNLLTAELNQTKLLLEGKNTQYNTRETDRSFY